MSILLVPPGIQLVSMANPPKDFPARLTVVLSYATKACEILRDLNVLATHMPGDTEPNESHHHSLQRRAREGGAETRFVLVPLGQGH